MATTEKKAVKKPAVKKVGSMHPAAKFSRAQVLHIRKLLAETNIKKKLSKAAIAREYNVTAITIGRIANGQSYKDIV